MIKPNTWNADGKLENAQKIPAKAATQKTPNLPKGSKKRARQTEDKTSPEAESSKTPETKSKPKKRGLFSRLSGD